MRAKYLIMPCLVAAVSACPVIAQEFELKQQVEVLEEGPMRIDEVMAGLYLIRGPFVPCTTRGCEPGGPDDGLIHEPGDVAVRVTSHGVVLIDNKYPHNVMDVIALVRSITDQPVRYVLNSHHHGDHVSGNYLLQAMGISVIGHRNIRENFLRSNARGAPDVVFANEGAVYLGDVEVLLIHVGRGHTDGDTITLFPDLNVIHMGDLVIDGMPVVDYRFGGSAVEFVGTLDRMLELEFEIAIPGHGRIMTKTEVRAYRDRLATMNERMAALIRGGMTKEQFSTLGLAREHLGLADLGWDNTVSTTAWFSLADGYYDEIAAQLGGAD